MPWMGIQDLWTFLVAVLVFLALPGPGTFTLLTATGRGGVRGGYTALAGLLVGDQILMWLALAGVAALLKANPLVFHAVQYLGAAYLVWVGISLLRTPKHEGSDAGPIRMQPGRYFQQAILVSLLNPKAILFYMAFLPLFIDPKAHQGLATFAALAGIILVVSIAYCSMLIGVGNLARRRLIQHPRISDALRRVAGLFLVGFGIRLGLNG
ncbi:leucine efflux protein LeuE [Stenotrophomonas sp. WZN-1]|uniref:leucine efflux protein LeuE n=1 Tax=unclassified Stenotrophomonas TaxID=196198 RepID=UPI000B436852|nr:MULTISPECIES: leucine efflux protein LeuE [unclassified Stenotrophomonas]ARZ76513.1 leucine efflux protein LeuE [Stenotrophomonas sp. WZN-1]